MPWQNLVPAAYFVLALRYAGYENWLSKRVYAAMSVFPAITIVVAWTPPLQDLLWRSVTVETAGAVSIFVPTYGPWYWINLTYVSLVIGTSMVVFATVILRSEPIHRKQSLLMFAGGVAPTVMNVLFTAGFDSLGRVDFTTTALAVRASDTDQLETVIDNVIENAVEHNDTEEPTVEITVDASEETATVRVADDGPGIPPGERRIISQGHETKLREGSSLGLWVIYWLPSAVGGTVQFRDNDPRGTVVVVQFQRAQ